MIAARTRTHRAIFEAHSRGYWIADDGVLTSPSGRQLQVRLFGKQRYPTFSLTSWEGRTFGIPVHMFAAYCFYGEAAWEAGIVVRHRSGDVLDLSKGNILLGSHSQNNMDKSASARAAAAKAARAAQGRRPFNAKLTPDQVREIRKVYADRAGKKLLNGTAQAMEEKYGVSRTVLVKIKNGNYYGDVA